MKIIKTPKLSDELENVPFQREGTKIHVPYYEGGVQAGFPSPATDFEEQRLSLDEKYITHPACTHLIRVKGNSMYPTLLVGDLLIVRTDLELSDNRIGIFSINYQDYTVKRYKAQGKILHADNEEFGHVKIQTEDTIMVFGIVEHLIRDL